MIKNTAAGNGVATSPAVTDVEGNTNSQMDRIYLSPPHMSGQEEAFVAEAFASNWVAPLGPQVDAFEAETAVIAGMPHALALSSGTAALHLAMRLAGVSRGDAVICSSLTFSATVNPVLYEGAEPIFVDSDRSTWNMDPELLAEALHASVRAGRKPKAVIVVDIYGQSADHDRIGAVCAEFGVPVIEDAAEALGADYKGRPAGSCGWLSILSFNGNKIITTSGGGMLLAHDPALTDRARFMATQSRDAAPHYQHSEIGYNYRMSNIVAAIGRGQLLALRDRIDSRRRNFAWYQELLGDMPGVSFMPEAGYGRSTRWLSCVVFDPALGNTREDVRLALERENIEARPVWKPMHLQPLFAGCQVHGGGVSAELFANGLCLPSGSALTREQVERIATIVRTCKGTA